AALSRLPPGPPLFPYTTLFRSPSGAESPLGREEVWGRGRRGRSVLGNQGERTGRRRSSSPARSPVGGYRRRYWCGNDAGGVGMPNVDGDLSGPQHTSSGSLTTLEHLRQVAPAHRLHRDRG